LTYYLPEKGGSHDFKFGFEFRHDYYQLGPTGSRVLSPFPERRERRGPDPVRRRRRRGRLRHGVDRRAERRSEIRVYGQDRWAPNNRLTITAGVRIDHQDVNYGDSVRKPLITDTLANGTRIFPASSTISGASLLVKTNRAARLGFSYDLTGKEKPCSRASTAATTTTWRN